MKRLNSPTTANGSTLNIQTLAGSTQQSSEIAQIEIAKDVKVDIFVVDTKLKLEPQDLDLKTIWPSLDTKLRKEVDDNMKSGDIDVVIGVDLLYRKISNTKTILHPTKGLVLLNTIFGYSIGGSTLEKEDVLSSSPPPNDMQMQIFTSTVKPTEPTIIRDEPDSTEEEIQAAMHKMFEQELSPIEQERSLTEDERFAQQQFKESIQYKDGKYYVKPLFKKEFQPMRNNYKIAERRYNSLRRQLRKDPDLERMYAEAIETLVRKR